VLFSGDKLLGGPQAGIVLGRGDQGAAAVKKMARHPLARAVRVDKLSLAALEVTLRQRLTGKLDEIPVERMLRASAADLRRRAAMWLVKLDERGVGTEVIEGQSEVGGGSLPEHGLPTALLAIAGALDEWSGSPARLYQKLTTYVDSREAEAVRFESAAVTRRVRAAAARWPKDVRQFSKELRRVVPQLRMNGLSIEFERGNKGRRVVITYSKNPSDDEEDDDD